MVGVARVLPGQELWGIVVDGFGGRGSRCKIQRVRRLPVCFVQGNR